MPRVLVVDDERGVQESLRMLLKDECEVVVASNADEALARVAEAPPDLVLLDLVMPGRSGLDLLSELREHDLVAPVVVLTATKTVATAVEAMKRGAADYITKPFEIDALRIKVRQLLERRELEREVARLRDEVAGRARLGRLLGRCAAMQELFRAIERVAESRASVLIRGESGTGKELVARAIHELGPRREKPFVAVNCAAIPESLMESELFGHERGAFTDAREQRIGKFESAHGGTLFLDEIGEISPAVQAKLLRVLQERTIERLGGSRSIEVDVRILAATNRDLEASIADGHFRADLYYRINVVPLVVPPLRARREDIPLLVEHVLPRQARAQDPLAGGPRGAPALRLARERARARERDRASRHPLRARHARPGGPAGGRPHQRPQGGGAQRPDPLRGGGGPLRARSPARVARAQRLESDAGGFPARDHPAAPQAQDGSLRDRPASNGLGPIPRSDPNNLGISSDSTALERRFPGERTARNARRASSAL